MKAFPCISLINKKEELGMDLRDYFAIRFAEVQLNLIKDEQFDALETFKTSYLLAEKMMKAREQ
jgi:hypothetical protein